MIKARGRLPISRIFNSGAKRASSLCKIFSASAREVSVVKTGPHTEEAGDGIGELLVLDDISIAFQDCIGHRMNDSRSVLACEGCEQFHPASLVDG